MAEQSDSRGEETPYNMQHAGNIPEVRSNEEFLQLQKDESETQRSPETFLDGKETFQSGAADTTTTTTGSSAPITSGMESSTVSSGMPSETATMRSSEPPGQNPGIDNPSGGIANESGGVSSTASVSHPLPPPSTSDSTTEETVRSYLPPSLAEGSFMGDQGGKTRDLTLDESSSAAGVIAAPVAIPAETFSTGEPIGTMASATTATTTTTKDADFVSTPAGTGLAPSDHTDTVLGSRWMGGETPLSSSTAAPVETSTIKPMEVTPTATAQPVEIPDRTVSSSAPVATEETSTSETATTEPSTDRETQNKGDDVVTGDTVGTTRVEDDTPARQPETRPPPDTDEKTGEPPADADKGGDKKPSEHKDMGKGGIARENKDAIPTAGGEKLGQKHWGESKMVPDVPKKENEGVASDEGQPDQQTMDNTNANTGDAAQDGEEKPGMMDKVKHALHMK